MKQHSPGGLIIDFFSRPIRWSDFAQLWSALRGSKQSTKGEKASDRDDFEPTRLAERPADVDAWGRSQEVDVSEEPFHTLPAALQDEFALKESDKGEKK